MRNNQLDKTLQIIRNDKPQQDYFFKKLAVVGDPFPLLKPLYDRGYFNPQNNPKPQEVSDQRGFFTIPYWNVLGYLENVANKNDIDESPEITSILLEIINSIIRRENKERTDNYHTDAAIIRIISRLPINKICKKHVDFVRLALRSKWKSGSVSTEIGQTILPKLTNPKSKVLLLGLLDVLFEYVKSEKLGSVEYISILDEYWLNDALEKNKTSIAKLAGPEAAKVALKKIDQIVEEDKSQFNIIWIRTIEDHEQTSFPNKYECQLVRFVRDMFQYSDNAKIKPQISKLLQKNHSIFKRIALHIIGTHYDELQSLFWNWQENPLNEPLVKHELYELFSRNCSCFSEQQIEIILRWIESKEYYVSDDIKKDASLVEEVLAYRKKEWLSALLKTDNPKVKKAYDKYNELNSAELEHPGFDMWMESGGWRGPISPIDEITLNSKDSKSIVEYLNKYQEDKNSVWNGPSQEGLLDCFKRCVTTNPKKYSSNMVPFEDLKTVYKDRLLRGFHEAWKADKKFTLDNIFSFIVNLVEQEDFWQRDYSSERYNYREWLVSTIAEFIGDGTKDDSHAFDTKYLNTIEKILLLLLEKVKSDYDMTKDLTTYAPYSIKGKIFTALINYSLRYARLYNKDKGERWPNAIKTNFEARLDRNIDPSIEYSTILGMYLPNLLYLDKQWVIQNIDRIFLKKNANHWKASFVGYLYNNRIYKEIYFLLKDQGNYKKALETDFGNEHCLEHIVQHVCLSYLEGWEELTDDQSLVSILLRRKSPKEFSEIVHYIWIFRDKLNNELIIRIKTLWRKLYEVLLPMRDNLDYQKVIADLYLWMCLIDSINDQIFEWLSLSVQHIKAAHEALFFIEYLLMHVNKAPEKVAKLYLLMVNRNIIPDYKKDDIYSVIEKIYKQGHKDLADRICNQYFFKGYEFLRDIYRMYQNLPKTRG